MDDRLYRAARHLIATFGKNAAAVANRRAENIDSLETDGAAQTWRLVGKAVRYIEETE